MERSWPLRSVRSAASSSTQPKDNETKVVVSTNALEEGIDVDSCSWVVRFDRFNTTKERNPKGKSSACWGDSMGQEGAAMLL